LIVVDASAMAAALAVDDERGPAARRRLSEDEDQHSPHLLDLEVASVIRRLLLTGVIERDRADRALADLIVHPLARYPHLGLLPGVWDLRDNLTPYDAAYVALAEALHAVLVTADARLAGAPGLRCKVELLA
jgi:predicted nucleic acid-binding protein